jgi:diacylglycerol O-acyltransferase / wax synthase
VLLDKDPAVKILGGDEWHPHRHPSNAGLLASALHDNLTERDTALDTARQAVGSALRTADRLTSGAGKVIAGLTGRGPDRGNALSGELSQQRRVVGVETRLADYRSIRKAHGGTINDVILATLTGALRAWLMTRSESMGGLRHIQAVVPVSVIDRELEATSLGSQIAPHFVTLPISEASPVVRLHQVSYSFKTFKDTGRGVAANRLAGIAGFAPTTFHAIGSRVAAAETRRGFQLSITNVPGPQSPLYAAGARMLRTFPIPPLLPGQTLAIGVTSYDGKVFYGITADRDLVPDADVLGQCVTEALTELLDTATGGRPKIPRGRRKKTAPKP